MYASIIVTGKVAALASTAAVVADFTAVREWN
jgi:hypothetical protein